MTTAPPQLPPEVVAAQRILARARRIEQMVGVATTVVETSAFGATVAGAWLYAPWLGLMTSGVASATLSYLLQRRRS